jgi:hypothetical protein
MPIFDAKEKINFRIVQPMSMVVKSNMVHMINPLQVARLIPRGQ